MILVLCQILTSHCKSEKAEKFQNKSTLNSHFNHIQFTFEKHKNSSWVKKTCELPVNSIKRTNHYTTDAHKTWSLQIKYIQKVNWKYIIHMIQSWSSDQISGNKTVILFCCFLYTFTLKKFWGIGKSCVQTIEVLKVLQNCYTANI